MDTILKIKRHIEERMRFHERKAKEFSEMYPPLMKVFHECLSGQYRGLVQYIDQAIQEEHSKDLKDEIPPYCIVDRGHPDPVGRRGRQGGVPMWISEKAEAYQKKIEPPYDADDIISAYECGMMSGRIPLGPIGPSGHPDPAGVRLDPGKATEVRIYIQEDKQ
jgi:hypothetical protein